MSSCFLCPQVTLFCCGDEIILGDEPQDLIGDLYLHIHDDTNTRKVILPIYIVEGMMVVSVLNLSLAETHAYEFFITTEDMQTEITWTINEVEVTCLQIRFEKHYDNAGEIVHLASQTIIL